MLQMRFKRLHTTAILGLVLALGAQGTNAAQRAPRHDRDRPAGQWTRHTEGQRTENGRETHSTVTNAKGKTATRDVNVARNAETGTRTRNVVDTGPNGGQRTVSDVTQRTDNGHTNDRTVTRVDGSTTSRSATVANDRETGTRTKDVVYTGPNGGQATNSVTTQRTEDGYTRSATATGPNGGQATRDVTATFDPATGTWTRDVIVNGGSPTP